MSRNTRLVVQQDERMPGAVIVDFAPIGASVGLLSAEFVGKWRLAL
jgi:hypothetical protein